MKDAIIQLALLVFGKQKKMAIFKVARRAENTSSYLLSYDWSDRLLRLSRDQFALPAASFRPRRRVFKPQHVWYECRVTH